MNKTADQISELSSLLRAELDNHVRLDASLVKDLELKLRKANTAAKSLESKLEDAQDELVFAKRENEKLSVRLKSSLEDMNQSRSEIALLKSEFEQFKNTTKSAFGELEIYRKQGKSSDSNSARRVAIGLAQHCLELAAELAKLREDKLIQSGSVVEPKATSGWGLDDDDSLFD